MPSKSAETNNWCNQKWTKTNIQIPAEVIFHSEGQCSWVYEVIFTEKHLDDLWNLFCELIIQKDMVPVEHSLCPLNHFWEEKGIILKYYASCHSLAWTTTCNDFQSLYFPFSWCMATMQKLVKHPMKMINKMTVLHVSVMVVDGVVLFRPTSNSPNRGKMKYLTTEIGSNLNFIFSPLHFSSWLHL